MAMIFPICRIFQQLAIKSDCNTGLLQGIMTTIIVPCFRNIDSVISMKVRRSPHNCLNVSFSVLC